MSSERLQFVAILSLSGLLLLVSVGFAGGPADDNPAPERLVREAVESTSNESIQGVRTEVFQRDDQFEMVRVSVAEQPPEQSRIEVIEAIDTDDPVSDLTIVNGSTMWQYYQDEKRAVRMEADDRLRSGMQPFRMSTNELLDEYEAEYVGTESIENRQTHVVELAPPADNAVELSLDVSAGDTDYDLQIQEAEREQWFVSRETWWIDTDTRYPIKQQIEWTDEEGAVIATTVRQYTNLTVGADISDDRFGFEPPNDVEVNEPTLPETETYTSRDDAASAVPFEIPDPTVPNGYDLHEATVQLLDGNRSVMLTYLDDSDRITFHVSERSIRGDERTVETDVGEISGTLVAVDGRSSLTWDCGSLSYRVSGLSHVDSLTDIAESVGCQSASTGDGAATDGSESPMESPRLSVPGKVPAFQP